ncbi:hypothetical protein Thimo_0865 [Thioflavicoccus mobilis 8321]|uniref:Uncharacterized protein n=2 Tax=Thioflavicoccus mobilis TaxID=80679 RepID=L0GWF1_9GAMM|nr:hypothetical protein Thimo_0865 [Thioflavicoccus mobilis 8321]
MRKDRRELYYHADGFLVNALRTMVTYTETVESIAGHRKVRIKTMSIKPISKEIAMKLSHWLWFGLILSILPIIFTAWKLSGSPKPITMPLHYYVISHGELLLICMSTLGGAIGEIITKPTGWRLTRLWIVGTAVSLALFSAYSYSEAFSQSITAEHTFFTSALTFAFSLLTAVSALILPATKEDSE